jgi:hypothetical protein
MRRPHRNASLLLTLVFATAGALAESPLPPVLLPPTDYVVAKLEGHPVVILGEGHWTKHDAQLVAELVPRLAKRRDVLAMETLRASDQEVLDRLLAAAEWGHKDAMRLMRSAGWPYREYLDILRAAWEANRREPGSMRVLGLSPDPDFRAKGVSYDAFMADLVSKEVEARRRVLVYCGIHHGFTRYHQPELDLKGFARAFMDRMGNVLRRRFGERVFLITLHRPVWCGKEPWSYCLPLGGAIDCAAASAGGKPIGFDVAASPIGGMRVDPGVYYARGYASLRLDEMTDGYIWFRPIEAYEDAGVIPLDELAPDEASWRELATRNPFSDEKDVTRERLRQLWKEEEARRADPLGRGWRPLAGWRERCR